MIQNVLKQIIQFVESKLELKEHSINLLVWEWVLKERMKLCEVLTYQDYFKKLQTSIHELQELIELIVVPETWFFRDKPVFDFLTRFVANEWPINGDGRVLRILSVPCSTGEEPYSIAMTLFDAGLSKTRFKIDAIDISRKALAKAEMGIYGKNSFRGKNLSYLHKYFYKIGEQYSIKKSIKDQVHFYGLNILKDRIPFEPHTYQIIFCRNLLIYLHDQAQKHLLNLLDALLDPSGCLIIGSAELELARQAGFVNRSSKHYVLGAKNSSVQTSPKHPRMSPIMNNIQQSLSESSGQTKQNNEKIVAELNKKQTQDVWIHEAMHLADRGSFEEATDLCLRYLHQFGAHAQIYYLLGLMQQAIGRTQQAEEFFQKAIYLDPLHYETLIHLSLLAEKKGNLDQASRFFKRAEKVNRGKHKE